MLCQSHTNQFHNKHPQSGGRKKLSRIKGIYASNIVFLSASSCHSAPCGANLSCVLNADFSDAAATGKLFIWCV